MVACRVTDPSTGIEVRKKKEVGGLVAEAALWRIRQCM
jgi:hypothetical protein